MSYLVQTAPDRTLINSHQNPLNEEGEVDYERKYPQQPPGGAGGGGHAGMDTS